MAERLLHQAAGDRHAARSASADPHRETAEPAVLEALREVGIDASDHRTRTLEQADVEWADVVIAACDRA
jgi:protein-tyrosine-phosphatase